MPQDFSQPTVFLRSGTPHSENEPTLLYPGQLGIRFAINTPPGPGAAGAEDHRDKGFQLVATDSTMGTAPFRGAVAWWADKTRYQVTTDPTTLGRGAVAGVFLRSVTAGNYCCIQYRGPATVKYVDAPTAEPSAARLHVIPSATAGKADCLAAASAPTYPLLGLSAGVRDGNSEGIVDLTVPETV